MSRKVVEFGRSHARVTPGKADGLPASDRELLRRFANLQDQAAFESLFTRHGNMVLAAARRILGNTHDAEDVCQAAFILIAKKAATHRWQPSIAAWLHRTAHLLALKSRTAAARRVRREERAGSRMPNNPLTEMSGQELLAVLDEELLALPESLRAPLVLCYLQGATRDEAAERLGIPLGTLKNHLERGRDQLHAALVRRGLSLSTVLLGMMLTRSSSSGASELLSHKTATAAASVAAGRPIAEAVSGSVCQMVEGGFRTMVSTKVKAILAVLLLGGLVASTGAIAGRAGDDKTPVKEPKATVAKPSPQIDSSNPPTAGDEMRVLVLGPQGKPLSKATVYVGIWTNEKEFKYKREIETDAAGTARVQLPKTFFILRLWANKKSFASLFANWEQAELASGKGVPAEYAFRLEKAVTAGGRVMDPAGKPVAGARVQVEIINDLKPPHGDGRVRYDTHLAYGTDAAVTDANGRWHIDNVPDTPGVELWLLVSHPDFVSEPNGTAAKALGFTTAMLRAGTAKLALKRGVIVRGRVTDPAGKPVKNAIVIHGDDPYGDRMPSSFVTDDDGRYRLPALPPGTRSLTVIAPGWAPQMRKVNLKDGLPAQDFRLAAGKPVKLRFVDSAGKPVPNARVFLKEWRNSKSIYSDHNPNHPNLPGTGISPKADAAGLWVWPAAPDDPVKISVYADGFAKHDLEVAGGSAELQVVLKTERRFTGRVTDAVTGKPIPAFTIIPVDVFGGDNVVVERYNAAAGKNGRLDFLVTRSDIPTRVRIEAAGYRTQDGPEFRIGVDSVLKRDFRLQPSAPLTGVVLDIDGKPASKAEVLLATPTEQASLSRETGNHTVLTDARGQFQFPDPGEKWAVVARTEAGIAFGEFPADRHDAGTLRLRAWASVKGQFKDGGAAIRGATVVIHPIQVDDRGRPQIRAYLQTQTDADGRFEFARVPPGPLTVRVILGPWSDPGYRSGPAVPLDLKPGQNASVMLGTGGTTLIGKVKLTGKVPADLDCNYSLNYLVRREQGIVPPPEIAALGFDASKGWRDTWMQTREGLAYLSTLPTWFVKLQPDGSFRVSGVPAGEYDLAVRVYAKPSGCLVDPLAQRVVRVTVTPDDVALGELTVPPVTAEVVPIPDVGDTPALAFKKVDGSDGKLAVGKAKYTLVHFWASWCGPCKKQLPSLRVLHERYATHGLATLSLSLDDDSAAWQGAVEMLKLPWTQGRLASSIPGVSSVPAYWLLDSAGKIVAKVYEAADLSKMLGERLK